MATDAPVNRLKVQKQVVPYKLFVKYNSQDCNSFCDYYCQPTNAEVFKQLYVFIISTIKAVAAAEPAIVPKNT